MNVVVTTEGHFIDVDGVIFSRSIAPTFGSRRGVRSRTEPLAATGPARVEHPASATGRHPGPEAVPTLAHQLAGLIGPLHGSFSA